MEEIKKKLAKWDRIVNQESIDVYLYILHNYPQKVNDNFFQFVYRSFYRLDNAGLSDKCKKEYFRLLSNKETSLEKILKILHQYKTKKNEKSYQLSFTTKLLHTIDNNLPIYDSFVAKLFNLPTRKSNLNWNLKVYDLLRGKFNNLLQDSQIMSYIKEFKIKHHAEEISDAKALDFMLWGLGKHQAELKKRGCHK
jgi:hypothetical protein